jgi:hypothetical protein
MNLDRFQPPTPGEELYRCASCGEMIGEASNVFIDDVPYHLHCVPEPPFKDDEEPVKHQHHFQTWIGYCTVCALILIVALFVHPHSEQMKGIIISGALALASVWMLVRVCRG